jgi:hypothetical protein
MLCFLPCIKPTAFAAAAVHSIDRLSTHDASRIFYAMHTNTIAQRMIINWCIHNEIFNPTHCEMIFFSKNVIQFNLRILPFFVRNKNFVMDENFYL